VTPDDLVEVEAIKRLKYHNAEGVGLLMERYAGAAAYLHCSSTAVYQPAGSSPRKETDPLGDNHRGIMETYSITKIAAEAVARTMARAR
jgi:UDP-glucuronate 4-epimerase